MSSGVLMCGHEERYLVAGDEGTSFCWMCEYEALDKGAIWARVQRENRLRDTAPEEIPNLSKYKATLPKLPRSYK